MIRHSIFVLTICAMAVSTASGAPSFVSVAGDLSNISPNRSAEIVKGGNLTDDGLWGQRDGFGENGITILEGWNAGENVPVLSMTLGGLTAGETYSVWVNYVRFGASAGDPDGNRGGIRASLDGLAYLLFNGVGGSSGTPGHAELTGFTNGDRVGLRGYLGNTVANGAGEITLYVDDDGNGGGIQERVWFDGGSYELIAPDTSPPMISSFNPDHGAMNATVATNLSLTFSESVKKGTNGNIVIRKTADGNVFETIPVTSAAVTTSGPLVTINPASDFAFSSGYYVEVDNGAILDLADNAFPGFSGQATWSFSTGAPPLPGRIVEVAPDGTWTWFNDERAVYHQGYLFSGYVRSNGQYGITRFDPATDSSSHMIISTPASQSTDDHNNPSITVLPDGRLLAVYSKHSANQLFYYRTSKISAPALDSDWNDEQSKHVGAGNSYANTFRLSGESDLIYNFHRALNWNPTVTTSADNGITWGTPVHFINKGSGRPYPRYVSNNIDRIDLIYTDGHPRDLNNSIYHLYYQGGNIRLTDGSVLKSFANLPLNHDSGERGTVVYPYNSAPWGPGDGPDDWIPGGRGWTWDIHYDRDGHPVCVFQVQRDNVTGNGWNHDRIYYYYARWTGSTWQRRFIAHGGRGLYSSEDDYGGGIAIDPDDPRIVYISSNAGDPFALDEIDNVPLAADSRYEIWRGFTSDGGLTFTWDAVTSGSSSDNLRPIVPAGHGFAGHVVWFQGTYSSYTNFSTRVMGYFGEVADQFNGWAEDYGLAAGSFDVDSDLDGLVNGLEYALGGNPNDAADRPAPQPANEGIRFRLHPSHTDIEWVVQVSGDLVSWTDAAVLRADPLPHSVEAGYVIEPAPGDPDLVTVKPTAVPLPDRLFMRVTIRFR